MPQRYDGSELVSRRSTRAVLIPRRPARDEREFQDEPCAPISRFGAYRAPERGRQSASERETEAGTGSAGRLPAGLKDGLGVRVRNTLTVIVDGDRNDSACACHMRCDTDVTTRVADRVLKQWVDGLRDDLRVRADLEISRNVAVGEPSAAYRMRATPSMLPDRARPVWRWRVSTLLIWSSLTS